MARIDIVCGAGYGDEGKGQTVHLLSTPNTCVVRFNGGAQAGHTVTTHDGSRNVFHQFGSGSYKDAATYLGPEVIVNAMMHVQERELFPQATVCIDANARMSTIVDVVINQIVEKHRQADKHGSCGLGINETVVRHATMPLVVGDISQGVDKVVTSIWKDYGPARLAELGCEHLIPLYFNFLTQTAIERSIDHMLLMARDAVIVSDMNDLTSSFDHFVFEGAQGLLLSERNMHWFPHLTRSDTGVTNALNIVGEMSKYVHIDDLTVHYVTRPYLTRHGAGPLANEWGTNAPYDVEDQTNIPNPWQDAIRYAPLDVDQLSRYVKADFARCPANARGKLVVSCMGHVRNYVHITTRGGILTHVTPTQLIETLQAALPEFIVDIRK